MSLHSISRLQRIWMLAWLHSFGLTNTDCELVVHRLWRCCLMHSEEHSHCVSNRQMPVTSVTPISRPSGRTLLKRLGLRHSENAVPLAVQEANALIEFGLRCPRNTDPMKPCCGKWWRTFAGQGSRLRGSPLAYALGLAIFFAGSLEPSFWVRFAAMVVGWGALQRSRASFNSPRSSVSGRST